MPTAFRTMTTTTETCTCPNCDGTGKLPHYSHIANGDCFACGGTGVMTFKHFIGKNKDIILEVNKRNGEFWYASLRCRTWKNTPDSTGKMYHTWGRDLWAKDINDVEEARSIWRTAKQNGIKTTIWDD